MTERKRWPLISALVGCGVIIVAYTKRGTDRIISPADAYMNGDSTEDVFQACNRIVGYLPDDARTRFTYIRLEYLAAYGIDRTCDKLRGKSVQQIIDKYEPTNVKPIESGEVDGIQYSLFEAPKDPDSEALTQGNEDGERRRRTKTANEDGER